MKAVIFGVNGQDGYYLHSLLAKNDIEVIGVSRTSTEWLLGDIKDREMVKDLIKTNKPEYVFHLAANSTTNHNVLFENHETISTGTLNVLEATYRYSPNTRVFISGSALQFQNLGLPVTETDPFEANSSYAVARIQSVYAARYYRHLGVKAYVGYFFHHDSSRRAERHINMKIAQAALRISKGSSETIEIGNIDVVKEYNYAGDLMQAIWLMLNQDSFYEAVIGSGRGYAIKEWINVCFGQLGKDWKPYVTINEKYKPEFMSLVSDPQKILSTGWRPITSINELADKMINLL